eukprot:50820_1
MFHLICTFLLISLQLQTSVHGAQASGLSSNTTIESNITDSQLNTYLISSHGLSDVQDKELESTYAESKESKKIRKKKKCNYCKNEQNVLKLCKGCFKTRYCDKDCQKRDWAEHRDPCSKPLDPALVFKSPGNKWHNFDTGIDPKLRFTRRVLRAFDGDFSDAEKLILNGMYIKTKLNKVDVTETEEKDADSNTALESDRLKLKIQKKIAEKKEERCGKKYQNRRTKKRGKKRKSHRK